MISKAREQRLFVESQRSRQNHLEISYSESASIHSYLHFANVACIGFPCLVSKWTMLRCHQRSHWQQYIHVYSIYKYIYLWIAVGASASVYSLLFAIFSTLMSYIYTLHICAVCICITNVQTNGTKTISSSFLRISCLSSVDFDSIRTRISILYTTTLCSSVPLALTAARSRIKHRHRHSQHIDIASTSLFSLSVTHAHTK